mmetsp:Transcript_66338/g.158702  ORF Transcript_66338/g.158702 Transcript_66338/m.158702 type:complete len:616 (+) Transcript_66338:52-1899(+)
MVRPGNRKSGGAVSSARSRPLGIEKYGADDMDEVLGLNADVDLGGGPRRMRGSEREVLDLGLSTDVPEEKPKKKKKKKKGKAAGADAEDDDDDDEDDKKKSSKFDADDEDGARPLTQGWSRSDYYGGEDLGDESDLSNDEDLIYEEARKLEELRAKRLKDGGSDVLASLMGTTTEDAEAENQITAEAAKAAAQEAHFDSLFAVEAETAKVERDLSKLSLAQQRELIKKEAPELMPLLAEFQEKLKSLEGIMPLLGSKTLKDMSLAGASYVKAKATLLMNTLANLSFYLLLRAEGVAVRAHPVVSQLVWLRELNEQMQSLDAKLAPDLEKAVQSAKLEAKMAAASKGGAGPRVADASASASKVENAQEKQQPKKMTLRDRVAQLRLARPPAEKADEPSSTLNLSTGDLLRMPAGKKKSKAKAEAEQEEVSDPVLGAWNPASLQEEIGDVHKRMTDQAAKAKTVSADANVAARTRKSAPAPRDAAVEEPAGGGDPEGEEAEEEEDPAKLEAARKKAAKEARAAEKLKAKVASQFRPETEAEDRRWASKQILENRGLVRQRKKFSGNARVANRKKYEQAVKKRRALVQDVREGPADGATYSGEETGIRTHVRKSMRLG